MSPSPRLLRPLALLTVVIGLPAHGDGDKPAPTPRPGSPNWAFRPRPNHPNARPDPGSLNYGTNGTRFRA